MNLFALYAFSFLVYCDNRDVGSENNLNLDFIINRITGVVSDLGKE